MGNNAGKKHQCLNHHTNCPNKGKFFVKMSKVKINGETRLLCPSCLDAFRKKQYCPFCYIFYFLDVTEVIDWVDDKKWVQCDNEKACDRWVSPPATTSLVTVTLPVIR